MKNNKKQKRHSSIAARMASTSQDEMQQRWFALRSRYTRWFIFFSAGAAVMFLSNHFAPLTQSILNIVNVAFQIFCVFATLFLTMTVMSFIYGKAPAKNATA